MTLHKMIILYLNLPIFARGVDIAQLVERRSRDRKVAGLVPGRRGGSIFFSRVNFLC